MLVFGTSRRSHFCTVSLFAMGCASVSCSGRIDADADQQVNAGGGANGGGNRGGGDGGDGVDEPGVDPGTKGVHRLNSVEYNATVTDVLGTKLQPANAAWLQAQLGAFDNMAEVLHVDADQASRYLDAAALIADDVFASTELKNRWLICSTSDTGCATKIIERLGLRLFRRPLAGPESATFLKLYNAVRGLGETHEGSIKQVLRALLSSAEFIYRTEVDKDPNPTKKHALTPYELASRLSYFIWSSAPDDDLLKLAADNSILNDDTLRAQVDRMLADPAKSVRFIENFAGQWLGGRSLPQHAVDKKVFPDWSEALANSLTKEMYLYFGEFIKTDRSWLDFLTADFNFIDPPVAKLYGRASVGETQMQRVMISDDQRFGFIGLGGFLALSSQAGRTSPTKRGHWILSNLLCTVVPPPPPGAVVESAGFDPNKNVRETLAEHRTNPSCAGCHDLFDPYGLSLEKFDAIGRHRTTYGDGTAIDDSAQLEDVTFSGLAGLAKSISQDSRFSECLPEFLLTYGLGRIVTDEDRPYLRAVHKSWMKEEPSIRRLLHALVLSEPFRYRRGNPAN